MDDIFVLNNISLDLDGNKILKELKFSITKNDFLGILGPSGSGKTTLLKLMIGLYPPTSGELFYKGKSFSDALPQIRKEVGFASQKYSFYSDLTLKENLTYFGRLYNLKKELLTERIDQVLTLVELTPHKDKKVMHISGGMQRRLDIACAMIHDPEVLFLDEPFTGLDPQLREHILLLIKKIWSQGKTIVLSSHFINEMEGQCKKVCILKEGSLLTYGTPIDIRKNNTTLYELTLQTSPGKYPAIASYLADKGLNITKYALKENKLVLYLPKEGVPYNYLRNVLIGLPEINEFLLNIKIDTISFEEIFEELVNKK
ncbi:MAG: ABC transporter ATP-binding protein [Candidatus Nanoarchaeia archaeon]